jgi:hypothetical protein
VPTKPPPRALQPPAPRAASSRARSAAAAAPQAATRDHNTHMSFQPRVHRPASRPPNSCADPAPPIIINGTPRPAPAPARVALRPCGAVVCWGVVAAAAHLGSWWARAHHRAAATAARTALVVADGALRKLQAEAGGRLRWLGARPGVARLHAHQLQICDGVPGRVVSAWPWQSTTNS